MSSYNLVQTQTESEDKILQDKGYKLHRQIGEGGYAKVYLGEFKLLDQDKPLKLACKIINAAKAPKRYVAKFLPRELKILVKLNHPHVIQVHSIFYRKMKYYIFMRHAELGDLLEYVLGRGALAETQARQWTRQIALAIQYLHVLEIAHRDLKCENILITANYNAKLSDFGFAKSVADGAASDTYCGSLSYAPPEILKGEPYNAKIADMWSFGILIYTMLNRANPFDSKNVKILYQNQMQKKWKFRSRYADIASDEVISLIGNMLEPELSKRYKVDQVLNSSWIAMDPKLKVLNPAEFEALSEAMDEVKSSGRIKNPDAQKQRRLSSVMKKINPNRNSLTFFKEYDVAFDLQHIGSDYVKQEE